VLSNAEVTIPLSTSGVVEGHATEHRETTFVGTGALRGGVLGGSSCTVVLAGTFNPIP
jgi:hypothetical protein